jgi:hypothetical protein
MTTEALKRKPTYYRRLILASCGLVAMAHRMIEWRGGHYAKITGTTQPVPIAPVNDRAKYDNGSV